MVKTLTFVLNNLLLIWFILSTCKAKFKYIYIYTRLKLKVLVAFIQLKKQKYTRTNWIRSRLNGYM